MTQIIAFTGKKQSGKGLLSNWLLGRMMKEMGLIEGYQLSFAGELHVKGFAPLSNMETTVDGRFDYYADEPEFQAFVANEISPTFKIYSFATPLKQIGHKIFGISKESLYGTNEQKEQSTHIQWPPFSNNEGNMSGRAFMQYFGTEICRSMYPDIWVDYLDRKILQEKPKLAVIDDVRLDNEAARIKDRDGKIIALTRDPNKENTDTHSSEQGISLDYVDAVIDNHDMDIGSSCLALQDILEELEILPTGKE